MESLYGFLFFGRKILNELSSDSPAVPKVEDDKTENEAQVSGAAVAPVLTPVFKTSTGQYSQCQYIEK